MELEDPRVKRAFVKYVLALQEPTSKTLDETFLYKFLDLLLRKFRHFSNGEKTLFSISIKEAADLLQMQSQNFSRLIVGREDRPLPTEFVFGRDFITNGIGSPDYKARNFDSSTYYFYMTPSCFARAAMKATKKGQMIRRYFDLMDRALRDKMGESLYKRLQLEDEGVTKLKEDNAEYIPFGKEPGNYDLLYINTEGTDCTYNGVTQDMNTRFQNHKHTKPGVIKRVHWTKDIYPPSKEQMRHRFLCESQVAVPDDARGYRDLTIHTPEDESVNEIVDVGHKVMDVIYARKHAKTPPPATVFARREDCPVKINAKKRKHGHEWRDGHIVHYDSHGRNPVDVQPAPKVKAFTTKELEEETEKFEHELETPEVQEIRSKIIQLPEATRKSVVQHLFEFYGM